MLRNDIHLYTRLILMNKKKVGVVCGGYSSEYNISIESGKNVHANIDRNLWEVYLIILNKKSWSASDDFGNEYIVSKGNFELHNSKSKIKLDVIFNLIHGSLGENGQLASLLELLEIPFSSCNSYNAALTFNKRDCLSVLKKFNIPTAKSYLIDKGDDLNVNEIIKKLGLPCFVKANRSGSSYGVFKVNDKNELIPSINEAFKEDHQLIIESALNGREFSVGVAKYGNKIHILPITEIITENDFFDFSAKYEGQSQEITPAEISENWKRELSNLSEIIFKKLGLSGFIRSEFIMVNDVPHLLEINSVPGMTKKSIIPQQVEKLNIKLTDFITRILEETINN